jgi:uncharacterized membrane protein
MDQDPNQQYPGQSGQPGEQRGYQGGYQPRGGGQQSEGFQHSYDQQAGDYQQAGSYQQAGGSQQANTGYQYQQYGQAGGATYNMGNSLGPTSLNLAPNISAALSYVFGWISGLFFFIGERRNRFVRFHAMQSILVFVALTIIWAVLKIIFALPILGAILGCSLGPILGIATFLIWAGLILMAFLGKEVKIPIISDYAARFAGQDRPL